MGNNEFVDYYEVLQLSPNADIETIERLFRHLAKKFHPDNPQFADKAKFLEISEAYQVLTDPESRASYDIQYQEYWNRKWTLASEASQMLTPCADKETRESLLSLLYAQRRRDMTRPGLGESEMARLLNIPLELVEFHMWYIKAKGWAERLDTGHVAITALGVDQAEKISDMPSPEKLIEDFRGSVPGDVGNKRG